MWHIFLVVYLVSPGYITAYNATEYEFDVNVYSPVGTVVFGVLLIVENINISTISVYLFGNVDNFAHNLIPNEMQRNIPLPITVKKALDPNDNSMDYYFNINYTYTSHTESTPVVYKGSANVILHEIGEL